MDVQDDPYDLLGVSRDASASQIRSAYRKAALQHHPDRVAPEDKATANLLFAKISNAYELLSDERKRAEFDQQSMAGSHASANQGTKFHNNNFQQQQHHPNSHFDSHFQQHFHFHDPFEVFRHVFREEFGGPSANFGASGPHFAHQQHHQNAMHPFMNDPFFADPFGRPGGSMFGGGGSNSIFSRFDDMFDSMRSSINDDMNNMRSSSNHSHPGSNYSVFSSSSTTSFGGMGGGESVTTQTTRRIVNGQEETVTERIVRKADGTVERQVLQSNNNSSSTPYIEQQQEHPALENGSDHSKGFKPWRRRASKQK